MHRRWDHNAIAAFTIVELLVVVSIITLLIAMLLPALGGARQHARLLKCQTVMKQTANANAGYADDYEGHYVYNSYGGDTYQGVSYTKYWATDPVFLERVGLSTEKVSNRWRTNDGTYGAGFAAGVQWPDTFDCPNQGDPKYWLQNDYWGHEIGIAYNRETSAFSGQVAAIKSPSDKFQFADGDNWWMSSQGSDYVRYFDLGIIDNGGWGGMLPRHKVSGGEFANIAYYDGHVDRRAKEETYFYGSGAAALNAQHWSLKQ